MTGPLIAASRMGARLTTPFGRGADTLRLELLPGAGAAKATVASYDFTEHFARFGRPAEPAYVLTANGRLSADTTVTVTFTQPGAAPQQVQVPFRAGTPAGFSAAVPVPVSDQVRLTALETTATSDGAADTLWTVTALLGTTAKLLWVIGGERDRLAGHLARVVAQRHLPSATGLSLDFIGTDLGVPRFPPLPYGFDAGTVALYHLDDPAGSGAAQDVTGRYPGRAGHPGTPKGTVLFGAPGRYGTACGFGSDDAAVEVATDPAFDIAANAGATVECFVRPDPSARDGQILFKHPAPGGTGAGWALSVGDFGRGLARNVRLVVSDGTLAPLTLHADVSLPTDAFTHVAGVLDRTAKTLTLFLGGVPRATAPAGALGAVRTTAPLRIGPGGSGFRGVLDEVRISAVARPDFAPVLGEADEHYRRRLRVFRRWELPTPANLTAMLNELVGTVGGLADPLVVDDVNAALVRGTRLVRVRPVEIPVGDAIDASGRRGAAEADAVGTAADEETFDPAFLFRYDRQDVDFTAPAPGDPAPGAPPPDPHLVQAGLAGPLDRLVALAAAEPGASGRLRIGAAFDPGAGDLRATGRAVLLGHSTVPRGRLAALAHRAGFDFVAVRKDARPDGTQVYAAAAPGDYFTVGLGTAPAGPADLNVGASAALSLRPAPPDGSELRWLTVPSGTGRGALATSGAVGGPASTTTLQATAPGALAVKAEVTFNGHTVAASRTLRIGLVDLPDAQSVAADGTLGAPPAVVSDPREVFDARFLIQHNDQRVAYGTDPDDKLMQPAVGQTLDALLDELARLSVTGQLSVTSAFKAGGDEFAAHGRTLVLRHSVLAPGALAALAHNVGFGHVTRGGADVTVRQAPGELVVVHGPAGTDGGLVLEVDEGAALNLSVSPVLASTDPPATGEVRLGWATAPLGADGDGPAHTTLANPTQPATTLQGDAAGAAWVQASYLLGDAPAPFTFRVGLRPGLDTPDTVISKDQYDLILNILNALHPVGVEVNTQIIRDHTVEVRGDLAAANPAFTFPKFRVRSLLPPQRVPQRRSNAHG
jgi:Concanavalin A-like lectin/glucanases superfamily